MSAIDNRQSLEPRWELATLIGTPPKDLEKRVEKIFILVVMGHEALFNREFPKWAKEAMWKVLSLSKITAVKETYFTLFRDKVLKSFKDDEIGAMLTEHREKRTIAHSPFQGAVKNAQESHAKEIEEALQKKCLSLGEVFSIEISASLGQMGIFPVGAT